jgi:Uma2 family endonuclease
MSSERYLGLVEAGVLGPDDRVELLEGVIVGMTPSDPPHAAAVSQIDRVLQLAIGDRAVVRVQLSFVAGSRSVPEPDLLVAPGRHRDYRLAHPRRALLVVEVSDSSLPQDRLTKAAIYAAAGVPEYWIVNLRDRRLEVHREPIAAEARYAEVTPRFAGDRIALVALPDVSIEVVALLPEPDDDDAAPDCGTAAG